MASPCIHRFPDGTACGRPTEHTRCAIHRRTTAQRGYGAEYRRNRLIVMAEAQGRCYVPGCHTPATTCDHIVPRRDGGGNDVANLRASCALHNYGWRSGQ